MLAKNFSAAAGFLSCLLGAVPAFSFPIQVVPHATTVQAVLNAFTPGDQSAPSVAARGAVGFIAVWEDKGDLPGGVKMRFLTAAGAPQGDEVWVDKAGPLTVRPRVSSSADGSFVVAWATNQAAWIQRFDYLGQPQGAKLQINPGQPLAPRISLDVAMAPDGAFVVIFSQIFLGGDVILAQRFDASGNAIGAIAGLDSGTPREDRSNARVTAGRDGSLLAVWHETAGFYVAANKYDAATGSWSGIFEVSADGFNADVPAVPLLYPDGTGMVVWNTFANGGTVEAQPLDAKGHLTGGVINAGRGSVPTVEPAAAADPAGNTYIVWSDSTSQSLLGVVLGLDRQPFHTPLPNAGDFSSFSAREPAVAIDGGGRAEVVWTSGPPQPEVPGFPPLPNGEDGSSLGIVGEVYSTTFCDSGTQILCLGPASRFMAGVTWKNPATGETGHGLSLSLTRDTGAFWFFGDQNLELMVKVVDGTSLNGNVWLYAGSLSNVEYTLTVEDISNGLTRTYHNPAGQFASFADVAAFPSAAPAALAPVSAPAARSVDTCLILGSPTSLCLGFGDFTVSVQFTDPRTGLAGKATAVPLTIDTGAFWFFDASNLELMIKVLDGRAINGKFWVFYGALSDVDYTITVTNRETGEVRTYHNPRGTLASHADVQAF